MTEARSAALPACSDGFDDVDGGPECGVYIQMRGVEHGARARAPETVLECKYGRAYLGDGGDHRCRFIHCLSLERRLVITGEIEPLGGGDRPRAIVGRVASIQHGLRHPAVDQPGV